ncbi:hypothetical protein, partial [Pandoraea sp.]|uniref:hypothetical protein n=1 Tax=Pandoraea sp. TaxID=1883445 RepID=UPI0035B38E32
LAATRSKGFLLFCEQFLRRLFLSSYPIQFRWSMPAGAEPSTKARRISQPIQGAESSYVADLGSCRARVLRRSIRLIA